MAAFAGGFEDPSDEGIPRSPLPPEDRIWRHPSELANDPTSFASDTIAVRRRWIERETSRGSAWTAGIVGAVLATGLVALGTHLATAFTSPPIDVGIVSTNTTIATAQLAPAGQDAVPAITDLSATMTTRIRSVGQSVAAINVGRGAASVRCLGVIIGSNGVLVAPASVISGASSLLVTLANGVQYVGVAQAVDPTSGIAVIRINGATNLHVLGLPSSIANSGEMALAITSVGGSTFSLGTVAAPDVADGPLVDAVSTDVSALNAPLGSAVLGSKGNLIGIVTGTAPTGVVATPTWLLAPVARQLMTTAHVTHGWLGMVSGTTNTANGARPDGVTIDAVAKGSAASEAGIKSGDVVTSLDGRAVTTLSMLRGRLYVLAPGTTVHLGILRDHRHLNVTVPLDERVPA